MNRATIPPKTSTASIDEAHVVIVTVKAMDHAQGHIIDNVRRCAAPSHVAPSCCIDLSSRGVSTAAAFRSPIHSLPRASRSRRSRRCPRICCAASQSNAASSRGYSTTGWPSILRRRKKGIAEPNYGGPASRSPARIAPRRAGQTLVSLHDVTKDLQDLFSRRCLPHIMAYAQMAAAAGAVPLPIVDAVLISGVQSRMVYHLAQLYGQPLTAVRFREIASAMGLGLFARQAARGMLKFVPGLGTVLGSVAAGAMAGALTLRARQSVLLLLSLRPCRTCSTACRSQRATIKSNSRWPKKRGPK